jgi:hypothetical protein
MTDDPTRLSKGSDELAASIAALREELPSDAGLSALAARLTRAGAPVEYGTPPPSAAVPKLEPSRKLELVDASKLLDPGVLAVIAALVVGAGLILGALRVRSDAEPTPTATKPVLPAATATTPAAASPAAATAPRIAAQKTPALPGKSATQDDERGGAALADSAPPVPAALPPGAVSAAPVEVSPRHDAAPVTAPSAPPALAPSAKRRAEPTHDASPLPESAPIGGEAIVESEVELLKKARSALSADPSQAFALSEQCRARYPSGAYAQEREYIAIVALARMGRSDEARSRAALFRMHYKNSAYLPRLTQLLGDE